MNAGTADATTADSVHPKVTISLVTYNGLKWLPGCLASVRAQSLQPLEVLVVDNASTDGTLDWLRAESERDGRIRLYESPENLGFARAHNRNIFAARGDFVCLLNQDVELDERFLEKALEGFHGRPEVAAVQGRLRRLHADGTRLSVLDSTGLVMHRDRRVVSRGQGEEDGPRHTIPGPVWGADGPAPVYRRDALLHARIPATTGGWEILDEDFFMYKEDVDLAWRLRLLGNKAWYTPGALAWHGRGTGSGPGRSLLQMMRANRTIPRPIKAVSWRNHRLMQIKNESLRHYLNDLPWILKREILSLTFIALADLRRLRAALDVLTAMPSALRKRRHIQKMLAHHRSISLTRVQRTSKMVAPPAPWLTEESVHDESVHDESSGSLHSESAGGPERESDTGGSSHPMQP